MRVPNLLTSIIFMFMVVVGCSSRTFTQPSVTGKIQPSETERFELLQSLGVKQEVNNESTPESLSTPDPTTPPINWIVALCGNWLAVYTVGNDKVEVLFIIREDSTFSSSAAMNGSRVTKWDHGIWGFDLNLLHISFKTVNAPDWKTAVFYGTHFNMYDNTFKKVAILPDWAAY